MTGVIKVDDIQDAGANSIVSSNGSGTLTLGSFTAPNITASTAILPDASDGAAIGSASLEWSDLFLADGAVINLGDDQDVTLTHVADTGIQLNSTMKLMFNDASQYIQGASATVLDIAATDEIELTATLVDINANVEISGTAVTTGVHTFTAVPVFPNNTIETADIQADAITEAKIADDAINSEHYTDGSIDTAHLADGQVTIGKLATAVLTGATDIGAALVDADLFLVDDGAGGTLRKTTAARIKTYIGGTGLAEADQFRLSASVNAGTNADITANLERADLTGSPKVGTGMSESSGVFTFPSTGMYLVSVHCVFSTSANDAMAYVNTLYTANNSSYADAAYAVAANKSGSAENQSACSSLLVDVTNTTNVKIKFATASMGSGTSLTGHTNVNYTSFTFLKLGDT